jgi:hypothetical protein
MGLLDNVLGSGVPGGNISKPLMIGLAALLAAHVTRSGGLGSLLGGAGTSASTPPVALPIAPVAEPSEPPSSLLGSLGGMLQRFQGVRVRLAIRNSGRAALPALIRTSRPRDHQARTGAAAAKTAGVGIATSWGRP